MANDIAYVRTEEAPTLPPPASEQGAWGWLWHNIFQSMTNFSSFGAALVSIFMIAITVFFGYALVMLIWLFVDFAFVSAVWSDPEGLKREICNVEGSGACWPFIKEWLYGHTYGNEYPRDEVWRVQVIYAMLAIGTFWLVWEKMPGRKWMAGFMLLLFPIIAFAFLNGMPLEDDAGIASVIMPFPLIMGAILAVLWFVSKRGYFSTFGEAFAPVFGGLAIVFLAYGLIPIIAGLIDGAFGFEVVPTSKWGGLLVTLVVALTGIIFSLPIGILLALGRRSNMPLIKWMCIVFIEVVRGIPLISVLFFASVMLSYFLPQGVDFNKLLRALIGVALFASAYMAEVVRGGLQAVPKGQYEGAMSLGLSYSQMMRLIVLPQALTIVIPGIVNTFIGLFKDTTLVLIISIFDLLGIGQNRALKDIDWFGPTTPYTEYLFLAAIFWVFCFGMSRYSVYMERKLARGHH